MVQTNKLAGTGISRLASELCVCLRGLGLGGFQSFRRGYTPAGRHVHVVLREQWLITYWTDHVSKRVWIVEIF